MRQLTLFLIACITALSVQAQMRKINGVSYVASRDTIVQRNVDPVVDLHANFASIMPFGFVRSLDEPKIGYNHPRQWYGETLEGTRHYIELLQKNGVSVMLKPQVWVFNGAYTGEMTMNSEADWQTLESSYRKFILDFAKVAQQTNCPIFCIGTELEQFVQQRPDFWYKLIREVRQVYSGKLTYAANWDEFSRVPFWTELDYIGVDAYFPISESKTPSVEESRKGWLRWKDSMESLSLSCNKPILFTEFGYRSMDFAGKEPWDSSRTEGGVNLQAQKNMTIALFEELWNQDWFAGGFVWKWFINYDRAGGSESNRFTPQNKPAAEVIRAYYSNYR